MEYKKDDLITLVIDDMGIDGEGIGKIDQRCSYWR